MPRTALNHDNKCVDSACDTGQCLGVGVGQGREGQGGYRVACE